MSSQRFRNKPSNLNGGRYLAKRRRAVGMTQVNLAKELGVPEIKITRIETGREELPEDLRSAALKAFKRKAQRAMDAVA